MVPARAAHVSRQSSSFLLRIAGWQGLGFRGEGLHGAASRASRASRADKVYRVYRAYRVFNRRAYRAYRVYRVDRIYGACRLVLLEGVVAEGLGVRL